MRRASAAFGALWVATAVGALAMVAMMSTLLSTIGAEQDLTLLLGILAADVIAFSTMGLLIERQRPRSRIAWVLGAVGALLVLVFDGFVLGALRFSVAGRDDILGGMAAVIGAAMIGPAMFVTLALLPILFPDGQLPGPRWRLPVALAFSLILIPSAVGLLQPGPVNTDLPDNPFGLDVPPIVALRGLTGVLPLALLVGAGLAVGAVVTRFRRSDGMEREQMKWLLGSVAVVAIALPASFADSFLDATGGFTVIDAIAMVSLALLPASIGVAVLRYHLYEIDRIISRTISWAVVTGILGVVFAGLVIGLQAALDGFTQGETLAVAASTLTAFALFQTVRRRVQQAVDRRFDRARYDADRTVAALAARLRNEVDLARLTDELEQAATRTVRPTAIAIWLPKRHGQR